MDILNKHYTTHMPMLIKCVLATDGPVLELGAGPASTPLLHWLCLKRLLHTYESNSMFYKYAKLFQTRNHRVKKIDDWHGFKTNMHWSVALVDQPSKFRRESILMLKDKVDFIVIHDTDHAGEKRYADALTQFKYRHDWKEDTPWTTVVSNTNDLSWLK